MSRGIVIAICVSLYPVLPLYRVTTCAMHAWYAVLAPSRARHCSRKARKQFSTIGSYALCLMLYQYKWFVYILWR